VGVAKISNSDVTSEVGTAIDLTLQVIEMARWSQQVEINIEDFDIRKDEEGSKAFGE
jgi:hypothetical protein